MDCSNRTADEAGGYAFAERVTGLCRGTLYSLVHEKRIPHVRLSRRLVRFRRTDLERWMEERSVPAVARNPHVRIEAGA